MEMENFDVLTDECFKNKLSLILFILCICVAFIRGKTKACCHPPVALLLGATGPFKYVPNKAGRDQSVTAGGTSRHEVGGRWLQHAERSLVVYCCSVCRDSVPQEPFNRWCHFSDLHWSDFFQTNLTVFLSPDHCTSCETRIPFFHFILSSWKL